jgi:hypothetical protein
MWGMKDTDDVDVPIGSRRKAASDSRARNTKAATQFQNGPAGSGTDQGATANATSAAIVMAPTYI